MASVSSRLILSGLLVSLVALAGCQSKITPIVQLKRQPAGKDTIYVQGKVRDRAPLLNRAAYQLQDETGKIWVLTHQPLPKSGQVLTIQAKIKTKSMVLNKQRSQQLYLKEMQRLSESGKTLPSD